MSRRRRDKNAASIFGDSDNQVSDKLPDVVNRAYGAPELLDADRKHIRVKNIPIDETYPDPQQPRYAVPSHLRSMWSPETTPPAKLFSIWIEDADLSDDDIVDFLSLEKEDDDYRPHADNQANRSLFTLLDVALSIKRDGLINPITVIEQQRRYFIETGERRWLAYHLLNAYDRDGDDWSKIPARIMPEFDVWRQAVENNARQDLNAIAKARQLALLIMDLHREHYGTEFEQFDSFEHEQGFYAQVADGNDYRIPRGKSDDLTNALGLSDKNQIRQYRSILRVPEDFWTYADDNDLTEYEIREAAKNDYTVTDVTLTDKDKSDTNTLRPIEHFAEKELPLLEKRLRKLNTDDRQQAIRYLEELLNKLRSD
jgi:hypothetical protein